jgi:hypothetical protein
MGCRFVSHVGEIGAVLHRQIDDRNFRGTRGCQNPSSRLNSSADDGNVNSRPVEHAALRPEVVLHVDD